jgi:hypothetical protein
MLAGFDETAVWITDLDLVVTLDTSIASCPERAMVRTKLPVYG